MKKITPEKIAVALERMEPRVTVPREVADRAREAIDRMLAVTA
jgi:quinolinate synthase